MGLGVGGSTGWGEEEMVVVVVEEEVVKGGGVLQENSLSSDALLGFSLAVGEEKI